MFSQAFSIVIASFTVELTYTNTDRDLCVSQVICYGNPHTLSSGHRICHNGIAAAVSSILACMILLLFDVFVPCVHYKVNIIQYT